MTARGALPPGAPLLVGLFLRGSTLLVAGGVSACSGSEPTTRFAFRDVAEERGLGAFRQVNGDPEKPFIVETVGAGVALLDAEGDGDLDVYLSNGSGFEGFPVGAEPRDALFLNDGSGYFTEGTEEARLGDTGWTNGVRVADVDGDGASDIYLTNYGPNVLYRNTGAGVFEDVTESAGVGDPRWSTGACFVDGDLDGDLDLYVANYIDFDEERMLLERPRVIYRGISVMMGPRGLPGARDRYYVNDETDGFRDASVEWGVDAPELFGFQCVTFDVDLDGWPDVYVANDSVANLLWHNEAGEGFTDIAVRSGLAFSMTGKPQAGMGVGLGDYDGDLLPDLYVTNFADDYFTLYRGRERGFFVDSTARMRLSEPTKTMLGWGCGFVDFDSDGSLEIVAVNGHVYPQVDLFEFGTRYRQKNQLFTLVDGAYVTPEGGAGPGFELEQASRGAAWGDLDGDGDMDLLIGSLDDRPALLLNESRNGRWAKLSLVDEGRNRNAVGARVVCRVGVRSQLFLIGSAESFLSSADPRVHVGLGDAERIDEVEVTWPDGEIERFRDLPAERLFVIERGSGPEGRSLLTESALP